MPSTINADTGLLTGTTGVVIAADGSGNLALQANATTVVTLDTNRLANFTGNVAAGNVSVTGVVRFNDGTSMNTAASGGGGLTWGGIQTSNFTSNVSTIYAVSTVSNPVVVTLPTSPGAGNVVQITDYAATWGANNVTINRNGANIAGNAANVTLNTSGTSVALIYTDAARGWIAYDGFVQSPLATTYSVSYLVVAGGASGGGGADGGGGGGAGGMLTASATLSRGTTYAITVGGGGAGTNSNSLTGTNGSNSLLGAIATSIGGGGGGRIGGPGVSGGSGGGAGRDGNGASGGAGTAGQGNAGGSTPGLSYAAAAGGGGAGAVGGNGSVNGGGPNDTAPGGAGGAGLSSSITGTAVTYAGGGGGSAFQNTGGAGGAGGGGSGGNRVAGTNGTAFLGGGGGGGREGTGGNGGSGVIVLSIPTAFYSGLSTGSPAISTSGSNTILQFTSSGSYTG